MENNIKNDDELLLNINETAKILNVVPATIRNWEKKGLFTAKRKSNNYRVYSLDDINILKKIKKLSVDEKMGSNAIKKILITKTAQNNTGIGYSKKFISGKWKECREKLNLTLEEVSNKVGISPSYLSKLENNQANISFDILNKLANFYGGSILDFFEKEESEKHVISNGCGEIAEIGLSGVKIQSLVSQKSHALDAMLFTINPGSSSEETHKHHGEEFIHILSGKIQVTLNYKEIYNLKKGDSMYFKSSVYHHWINTGNKLCKLIWVHSPFESDL